MFSDRLLSCIADFSVHSGLFKSKTQSTCSFRRQYILMSHSRFVTVFSICKVSLQSFDITPSKSFLSIIIIIIIMV